MGRDDRVGYPGLPLQPGLEGIPAPADSGVSPGRASLFNRVVAVALTVVLAAGQPDVEPGSHSIAASNGQQTGSTAEYTAPSAPAGEIVTDSDSPILIPVETRSERVFAGYAVHYTVDESAPAVADPADARGVVETVLGMYARGCVSVQVEAAGAAAPDHSSGEVDTVRDPADPRNSKLASERRDDAADYAQRLFDAVERATGLNLPDISLNPEPIDTRLTIPEVERLASLADEAKLGSDIGAMMRAYRRGLLSADIQNALDPYFANRQYTEFTVTCDMLLPPMTRSVPSAGHNSKPTITPRQPAQTGANGSHKGSAGAAPLPVAPRQESVPVDEPAFWDPTEPGGPYPSKDRSSESGVPGSQFSYKVRNSKVGRSESISTGYGSGQGQRFGQHMQPTRENRSHRNSAHPEYRGRNGKTKPGSRKGFTGKSPGQGQRRRK